MAGIIHSVRFTGFYRKRDGLPTRINIIFMMCSILAAGWPEVARQTTGTLAVCYLRSVREEDKL